METLCRGSPSERLVAKRLNPQTNRQQYRLTDLGREYGISSSASSLGRDEDDESDLEEIRSKRRIRLPSQSRRHQDGTATHRPGRPVSGAPAPPRPGKRPRLASEATVTALPDTSTGYLAALVQRTPVRTDVKEEEAIQVTVRKIATVSTLETATATENVVESNTAAASKGLHAEISMVIKESLEHYMQLLEKQLKQRSLEIQLEEGNSKGNKAAPP